MTTLWRRLLSVACGLGLAAGLAGCGTENCPAIASPVEATNVAQPAYPQIARDQGLGGTVLVAIAIDDRGRVLSTTLRTSSHVASLDSAALSGANASTYAAGILGCGTHGGNLGYQATFSTDAATASAKIVQL